jgi:hypothetical protein
MELSEDVLTSFAGQTHLQNHYRATSPVRIHVH